MIKKISLMLILLCFVISCRKKSDPEYKESQKKTEEEKVFIEIT